MASEPADRRIVFRIGINLGDIVVEGDDLLGDGVNVAARLEQLCEPGGVLVSGTAYDQLQGKLGLPLEFTGEQRVKNIGRPVRAYRVRLDGRPARQWRPALGRRNVAAIGAVAIALLAGLAWQLWPAPSPTGSPSIAILPLENRSGDARLGRLADGMIENVIGNLTGLGWDVMARGTTFAYRDAPNDPRRIARELGVGYVVEGSLVGDGSRLLASVALVDAATGRQVWSERYDRPPEDLFAIQDELALRIATSLGGAVYRDRLGSALRKRPGNLESFDLFQLAGEELDKVTPEANAQAIELLQRAIELDPTGADAHVRLARTYQQQVDNGWAPHDAAMARWLDAADQAVKLDPTSAWARYLLAQRYLYGNEMRLWWSEVQHVANMAQRDVRLMSELGAVDLPLGGQTARGVELVERAVRLDPARIDAYRWRQRNVYFNAGRFEEAATAAEAIDYDDYYVRFWNTLIYAELGRGAQLQQWRSKLLELDPEFSAEREFWRHGDFLMPEAAAERAQFFDAVAKAGLPKCARPEQLEREPTMRRMPECDAERESVAASKT
jgi:TolB-like protein/Tfp pilus assembly protein PilF